MEQNRRTICRKFMIILCVLALLAGCGKEETADVRTAEFPGTEQQGGQESGADQPEAADRQETAAQRENADRTEEKTQSENVEPEAAGKPETIWVYVCGQVADPGVYELAAGDRVVNALSAAGGMTEQAAETYLNQAEVLADGQKIYVPSEKEAQEQKLSPDGSSPGAGSTGDGSPGAGSSSGRTEKVNLNTAGKAELMTLGGIGESRAEAIISYREENGGFRSIEEIKKIEGIKEGIFGKIKDKITV